MKYKVFDVIELQNNNLATILKIENNKYICSIISKINPKIKCEWSVVWKKDIENQKSKKWKQL